MKSDHFISKAAFSNILEDVMGSFSDKSKSLICDATFTKSINPLRSILSLIFPVIQAHPELGTVESVRRTLPNLFVFGFLLISMPSVQLRVNRPSLLGSNHGFKTVLWFVSLQPPSALLKHRMTCCTST